MPILTIIAGPNGAGKSTHSKDLLTDFGIEAFDFDKEFSLIWSQFNFDPYVEPGVFEQTQELYTSKRVEALNKKQNFAFETNYHSEQVLSVIDVFRANHYSIELIFICLENSDAAIQRVKDRVAKGGHSVDEMTIRERFEKGLHMLDETFHLFDQVSIYLSKQNDVEEIAILEPGQKSVISLAPFPTPLTTLLPNLTEFIRLDIK